LGKDSSPGDLVSGGRKSIYHLKKEKGGPFCGGGDSKKKKQGCNVAGLGERGGFFPEKKNQRKSSQAGRQFRAKKEWESENFLVGKKRMFLFGGRDC